MSDPPSNIPHDHGLIVCDECEAIWLLPELQTKPHYPDPEDARCPICHDPLWGDSSHWASMSEIHRLGWDSAIDRTLDDGPTSLDSDDVIV